MSPICQVLRYLFILECICSISDFFFQIFFQIFFLNSTVFLNLDHHCQTIYEEKNLPYKFLPLNFSEGKFIEQNLTCSINTDQDNSLYLLSKKISRNYQIYPQLHTERDWIRRLRETGTTQPVSVFKMFMRISLESLIAQL